MRKLTPQQEKFAKEMAKGELKQVDCYRKAYPNTKSPAVQHEEARRLTKHHGITQRIKDLKEQIEAEFTQKAVIDREFITNGILETIQRTSQKGDDTVTLKGYDMLAKMYDLNEDKQNDRIVSPEHKRAILENLHKRLIDITPEET